jgi:ATP-binding cassette subfamily B protein
VALSYRRIRVAIARINAYLQEHIVGIAVLQLFNREKKSGEEFDEINRQHMRAFKDTIVAYGWFYPVVEFVSALALAAILGYGGWRIERGEITLGVVVAFLQYATRFFRPIQDLSEKYNILQSAMASSERVFKLLDTKAEITAPVNAVRAPEGAGKAGGLSPRSGRERGILRQSSHWARNRWHWALWVIPDGVLG